MKREQRHTVYRLAARARKGDEWALAFLARISGLAIAGDGALSGALSGLPTPRSESPGDVPATPSRGPSSAQPGLSTNSKGE